MQHAWVDDASPAPIIVGCAGLSLSAEEKSFFADVNPLGLILFSRNCENPDQIRKLIGDFKSAVGRANLPVLIDQEGGRVARLQPPHWRKVPPAGELAALAKKDLAAARRAMYLNARLIAADLHAVDINVNCAPLADIPAPGSHNIIGDRSYGNTPEQVSVLARQVASGLLDGGVLPVLKHIPGHGRALVDSHEALPQVTATLAELETTDFKPFRALSDLPLGMTAHIVYSALDNLRCATLSPVVIRCIRNDIGFDGVLMSDDLSMKALQGDLGMLTAQILAAGCDIALHCNGNMSEMKSIVRHLPSMTADAKIRLNRASAMLRPPQKDDAASMLAELDSLRSLTPQNATV